MIAYELQKKKGVTTMKTNKGIKTATNLMGLYHYSKQYLMAIEEGRKDNEEVFLEVIKKFVAELDELLKDE